MKLDLVRAVSRGRSGVFSFICFFACTAYSQVTVTTPLSFGAFVARSGGEVTITPTGSRSATGGVMVLSRFGSSSQGQIAVKLPSGMTSIKVILPSDEQVVLACDGAAMRLKKFTASSFSSGSFSIGATLAVLPNQKPCAYTGSFPVTVNFE